MQSQHSSPARPEALSERGAAPDYASYYEAYSEENAPMGYSLLTLTIEERRFRALAEMLGLPKDAKILDGGCGDGQLTEHLAARGWRNLAAMDVSARRLARLKKRLSVERRAGVREITGDVFHPPFAAGTFDAVVYSEVIEHVHDPEGALREAARVLKPNGVLLLSVPDDETIQLHRCIHCQKLTPASGHLQSFTEERLSGMARASGFDVLETRHFLTTWNGARLAWRLFRPIPYVLWKWVDRAMHGVLGCRTRWIILKARKREK